MRTNNKVYRARGKGESPLSRAFRLYDEEVVVSKRLRRELLDLFRDNAFLSYKIKDLEKKVAELEEN